MRASSPSGCCPSSTIIAKLSESDSLKSLPMRIMACTDGASGGLSDTECCCPTCSSDGTARVTIRISATQARMMNSEDLRIVRAMKGGWGRPVLMRPSLVIQQQGTYQRTGPGRPKHLTGGARAHSLRPPEPASQQRGDGRHHERTHDQRVEQQTEANGGTDLTENAQVADYHGPHGEGEHQARGCHDLAGAAHCTDDARVYTGGYFLFHP